MTVITELMRRVPHLLKTCVLHGIIGADCGRLRCVNKDSSVVALEALKSYSLKLEGEIKDSDISGAKLLRTTCLHTLTVKLT